MKIIITGHTKGVGKALFGHYSKEHEVIGVSRLTGYDLTKDEDIACVAELAKNADHFFNVANVGNSQSDLLFAVHKYWGEVSHSGKIVSFGTLATCVNYQLLKRIPIDMNMLGHKLALEKMHNELAINQPFGRQPQSVLLRFANYGAKQGHRANEPFTSADQLIKIVDFVLSSDTYISSLDFREI
jgi:hypothetical protein